MKKKDKKSKYIPLKNYKVLLLQIASRIIEKVSDTGLKPSSKRAKLATEIAGLSAQLEREFKRDSTLADAKVAKKALYDDLFDGEMPPWLIHTIFSALTEESYKLHRRSA